MTTFVRRCCWESSKKWPVCILAVSFNFSLRQFPSWQRFFINTALSRMLSFIYLHWTRNYRRFCKHKSMSRTANCSRMLTFLLLITLTVPSALTVIGNSKGMSKEWGATIERINGRDASRRNMHGMLHKIDAASQN